MRCPPTLARLLLVALTLGVIAACSTAEGQQAQTTSAETSEDPREDPVGEPAQDPGLTTTSASTSSSELASETSVAAAFGEFDQERPPPQPVTIAFGGDIHVERMIADALADDPETALSPVADMMADADIAIANLETAVTDRGTPSTKQFNFRTGPAVFDALRSAGIDVVSMANNHGLDYGVVGLEDSLAHAEEAGFPVIGIGVDEAEAYRPWSHEVRGQRIAVIAATQVLDSSLIASWTATDDQPGLASAKNVDRLVQEVEAARATHDTVVVFLHWGIEGETCPAPRQLELSDQLVAAGADVVVGGHAHRLQGGGIKDGAFVHYGLGNFVFYTEGGPGADSGVLLVTVAGRTIENYEWVPARLRSGIATALDGEQAEQGRGAWEDLRACTDLDP